MTGKTYAERLLTDKFNELGRLPVLADFSDDERLTIKSELGPWPRALEKAGLKPVSEQYLIRKRAQKERRRNRKRKQRRNR